MFVHICSFKIPETGSAITSTCVGLGNDLYPERGVAGKPVPGWNGQLSFYIDELDFS